MALSTSDWIVLVLSGIGIINTLYLSYHILRKTLVKCLFFPPEWCEKVQHSKQSKTFGIPNGFAGLAFYTSIFVLTLLAAASIVPFWPVAAIIVIGFLFAMYFTYVQGFVLHAFCTWCVLSAIDFTLLFATVLVRYYM